MDAPFARDIVAILTKRGITARVNCNDVSRVDIQWA